jgi:protocatechuate 3,4-dioxygenase beta subunit
MPEYKEYSDCKGRAAALPLTTPDIEGPFYKAGAPERGRLCQDPTMRLSGRVTDRQGANVAGVTLDFWQADGEGVYDNDGFNFRGVQKLDTRRPGSHHGGYELWTVKPGCYEIGGGEFRCPHIHAKLWAGGACVLTTQLYFPGGEHNDTDDWFDPSRVLTPDGDGYRFDFVIEAPGVS